MIISFSAIKTQIIHCYLCVLMRRMLKITTGVIYFLFLLQIQSNEMGADEAFVMTESGSVSLGLSDSSSLVQAASNAEVVLDGFVVTSESNSISGVLQGVNLELKQETQTSFQIEVKADSSKMQSSLEEFVTNYNNVIQRIQSISGFGENPADVNDFTFNDYQYPIS